MPAVPTDSYQLHSGHVLGNNKLGAGPHMGEGACKPKFDGHAGCKHTGVTESYVPEQRRSPSPLTGENESTDQEEPISFGVTTNMLGGSRNRFWKGHTTRGDKEVHPLHKRKGCKYDRKGRAVPYTLPIKEHSDEERGDHGYGIRKEEVFGDTSEVPITPAERIQACPFPATTRIPD